MIQTFIINFFAFVFLLESSHAHARIIHATMIRIKHITKTKAMIIFVKAHIIVGNASVGLVLPLHVFIQFPIIGKHVFNLIPSSHGSVQSAASTEFNHNHHKPNNTAKNHPNKYDNILFFINFGIKK